MLSSKPPYVSSKEKFRGALWEVEWDFHEITSEKGG